MQLNDAWERCMAQWNYVVHGLKQAGITDTDPRYMVHDAVCKLKHEFVEANKGRWGTPLLYCWFCEYVRPNAGDGWEGCKNCPAHKIDSTFHCNDSGTSWDVQPHAFYRRIKKLYKIREARLAKRKKSR